MQMDMGHDNGPREICILVPRGPRQQKKKKKKEVILATWLFCNMNKVGIVRPCLSAFL